MKYYRRGLILLLFGIACHCCLFCDAQVKDSSTQLKEIIVVGYRGMNGIGHFHESQDTYIYAGKKTEIIAVDSVDANKAINNTRQILGRIPGLNIVESETGGFVANGIGFRGLNPVQSLDMNVRQNGYTVAADVYGYNETYYLPPMEAVERIELIKGSSSLQFGPQLGGMVNYVIHEGSRTKPFTFSSLQTTGSNGLFNSYNAAGGTIKRLNYFTFINYRNLDGWRPNSQQDQLTGFGKLNYQVNNKLSVGIEFSLLRNKIKMPGGLTDEQFETDSRISVRSRNWLKSPWNILTANAKYIVSKNTSLLLQTTYLKGERNLVWINKLPGERDLIDPQTGQYSNREVDRERMKSFSAEFRLLHQYKIGNIKSALASGVRLSTASFERMEEGAGTNGTDFDLAVKGEYEERFTFKTVNIAPFIENSFKWNDRFSITPGIRFELLESEIEAEYEIAGIEKETEEEKERQFILTGIGMQYELDKNSSLYGNISQAYRPLDYGQTIPLGSVSKVDPDMKDPKAWNSDLGIRGTLRNYFNYDIGLFYLNYKNRVGTILLTDENGTPYTYRTNTAQSAQKGIESYFELNITRWLQSHRKGQISIYNSFAWTHARYTKGTYEGNRVEYAPAIINRVGITYANKSFSTSLQLSHQSKAYSDAANTERSSNPIVGGIPGYSVIDWSMNTGWKKMKFRFGLNNLLDKKYFTQRTDEYPGPGIIPSTGRSFYLGIGVYIF
jgi:Fe(3+) dicitrate transport protein